MEPRESIPAPSVVTMGGRTVIMAPRSVESVVSWHGSIDTFPQFDAGEELLQDIVVDLLNKGTKGKDRFELAADLEDRGAEISFGSYGTRVHFSGRALARDVAHVLALTAEQLREPRLDETEFGKVLEQTRASIRRSSLSTSYRAGSALRARLFSAAHPNFSRDPAEDLKLLEGFTIEAARNYHRRHFAGNGLAVCAAGDLDPQSFASQVVDAFAGWDGQSEVGSFETSGRVDSDTGRREIDIADRDNLDVRIGHAVSLRRDDPDFLPLYVANFILGGNFSARLMQKVRNEMGLTYGIGSALTGFDAAYDGMWLASVTLSKDRLEEGIDATLAELRRFVSDGVSDNELAAKKTTISGSYEVALSTTRGLSHTMHANFRNGFEADYLQEFPNAVRGLTSEEVNRVIPQYLDAGKLRLVVAGSVPEKRP